MQLLDNKQQPRIPFIQGYSKIDENPNWMTQQNSEEIRKIKKLKNEEIFKKHENEEKNEQNNLLSIIQPQTETKKSYNLNQALQFLLSGTVRTFSKSGGARVSM